MKRKVIKEIDRLIEEASVMLEGELSKYDRSWYRGFRAGVSAVKEIIERQVLEESGNEDK